MGKMFRFKTDSCLKLFCLNCLRNTSRTSLHTGTSFDSADKYDQVPISIMRSEGQITKGDYISDTYRCFGFYIFPKSASIHTACILRRNFSTSQRHLIVKVDPKKNYYSALGLTENCSQVKVKQTFYRLSKIYHPDKNKTPQAVKKFHDISEAYEVLSNTRLRQQYDESRRQHTHSQLGSVHRSSTKASHPKHFKPKGPLQTGRTSDYHYDAWVKEHYGTAFRKSQVQKMMDDIDKEEVENKRRAKAEQEERRRETERNEQLFGLSSPQELVLLVMVLLLLVGFATYKHQHHKDDKKEETSNILTNEDSNIAK